MYNLFIVDDEQYVIDQVRSAINWSMMGINPPFEARDGLEGLRLSSAHKPDIVVCDVHMPVMDGLSFASDLLTRFPDCQIIFLSGYSDPDYLKRALRLDAVDYIFKPFDLKEFTGALSHALEILDKKKSLGSFQDPDAATNLTYLVSEPARLCEYLRSRNLPVDFNDSFLCLVLRPCFGLSFDELLSHTFCEPSEPDIFIRRNTLLVHQAADTFFSGRYLLSRTDSAWLIFANVSQRLACTETAGSFLRRLEALLPGTRPVTIGTSRVLFGERKIGEAFRLARLASLRGFTEGPGAVYSQDTDCEYDLMNPFFSSISDSIAKREILGLSERFDRFCDYIRSVSSSQYRSVREQLVFLCYSLSSLLADPEVKQLMPFVSLLATLQDFRRFFTYLTERYTREFYAGGCDNKLIRKVQLYIQDHLSEDLAVGTIARQVYLTPTYLCYVFKKETGMTLNSFITERRLEKAALLLRTTDLRVLDIAGMVGYKKQNYFARVFAAANNGLSPSDYRKSLHRSADAPGERA